MGCSRLAPNEPSKTNTNYGWKSEYEMRYEFTDMRLWVVVSITASTIEVKGNAGDHTKATHPRMKRQVISKRRPCSNKQEDCEKPIINYQGVRNTLSARITFYCQARAD